MRPDPAELPPLPPSEDVTTRQTRDITTREKRTTLRTQSQLSIGISPAVNQNAWAQPAPLPAAPEDRAGMLAHLPAALVREAWFTVAHLNCTPGQTVMLHDAGNAALAYAMAVMNPALTFLLFDDNADALLNARGEYRLPNLFFDTDDDTLKADAVICRFPQPGIIRDNVIASLPTRLKAQGTLFIHDYMIPDDLPPYLCLQTREQDAPALIEYAENAFVQNDDAASGFYLEEKPARFPGTRLFRLPSRWAYEYMVRGHGPDADPAGMAARAAMGVQDYTRLISGFDMRLSYCAAQWDAPLCKSMRTRLRFYTDQGQLMLQPPPTSTVMLARAVGETEARSVREHKISRDKPARLSVTTLRNRDDGTLIEIVGRGSDSTAVIPYWLREDDRVMVYLHDSIARGLANAIPRSAPNLDRKTWSGHMLEAWCLPTHRFGAYDMRTGARDFARTYLHTRPATGRTFEEGTTFYPDPQTLDEKISTVYLNIEAGPQSFTPLETINEQDKDNSRMQACDVQAVLNAIAVGVIPNAELECQLIELMRKLGKRVETWAECPLVLAVEKPAKIATIPELMALHEEKKRRYEYARGTIGSVALRQSVFTFDKSDGRAPFAHDYVAPSDGSTNRAVFMPLTRDLNGEVLAGLTLDPLPIPERYEKQGRMMHLPSLPLPADITSIDDAKRHIAAKLNIKEENVCALGESYFTYVDMTPQRIYPFAVTAVAKIRWHPLGTSMYAPLEGLFNMCWPSWSTSYMRRIHEAYASFMSTSDVAFNWGFAASKSPGRTSPASARGDYMRSGSYSYGYSSDPDPQDGL